MGLDKGRLEVYGMVAGLFYDLNVDYATQVWKEFIKSLENICVVKGISCAQYWSPILQYVYEKEGIQVPADESKANFMKYHFPKSVEDYSNVFQNVARIPDGLLKKIDPSNAVSVSYLMIVNPSVETGILLQQSDEGSFNKSKKSKKVSDEVLVNESPKKVKSNSPMKNVGEKEKPKEKVVNECSKELIPSKSGVFKRLKKMSHKSRTSSNDQSRTVCKA